MPSSAEVLKMDDINEDMNVIDESLKGLDDKLTKHEANLSHIPYAVAIGNANTYEVTIDQAPTAYEDGMAVCVKINESSTGTSTLNVNGLGAQAIVDLYGNPITSEGSKVNTPYIMRY